MYLCIICSHEVTEIAGWNADISVLSDSDGSTLNKVEISTDVEHYLPKKTTPVDGISNSVTNICIILKSVSKKKHYSHSAISYNKAYNINLYMYVTVIFVTK